jgi:hypothetical protein
MVDDIMTSNGIPAPGSVTTAPSKHTIVAGSSVNRAMSRIWSAAQWDWRVVWINFEMETITMFYDLPDDYEWFCTPPVSIENQYGLQHISYERLIARYPDLYYLNEETRNDIGGAGQLSRMFDAMNELSYFGIPRYWGVKGSQLFLFEIPQESSYLDTADWDKKRMMMFSYYGSYQDMTADDDVIPSPPNLNDVVFFLANAYFKQAFEYPDFSADESRGEAMLNLAVNRNKMIHPEGTYSHFQAAVTPWGPYYGS